MDSPSSYDRRRSGKDSKNLFGLTSTWLPSLLICSVCVTHYMNECVSGVGGDWSHLVPYHWKRVASRMTEQQAKQFVIDKGPAVARPGAPPPQLDDASCAGIMKN